MNTGVNGYEISSAYLHDWRCNPPARVLSQPSRVTAVHRCRVGPRPAAELGALVVGNGLTDLGLGVHDERAMLGDRLGDRFALQQQIL